MAKWRVKKNRGDLHWVYQWVVISPAGFKTGWATWRRAMGHVETKEKRWKSNA